MPEQECICVSREVFLKAIEDELIDHFRWSSVQGLVELEAGLIARSVLVRILDYQKERPEDGLSDDERLSRL